MLHSSTSKSPGLCADKVEPRSAGAILLFLLLYAAILLAAGRLVYSKSGFLLLGVGAVILLDRYVFRLLPWKRPLAWRRELAVRLGYFTLGALGFYLSRPGTIQAAEPIVLGTALSLAALLFESAFGGAIRLLSLLRLRLQILRRRWLRVASGHGLFFGAIVFVLPLFAFHLPHTVPTRTPASLGLAFQDVTFTTSDGLELGGWLVPQERARANVIFCHGHGRNRGHVMGLLPTLHDLGCNVLAFDFRGHGESPGHTETFGPLEVEDLRAAESFLTSRFPGKPLFLVGISYGAAVALQALPDLPGVQGVWAEGCFRRLDAVAERKFSWLPGALQRGVVSLYCELVWLDCGVWGHAVNPIDRLQGLQVPICFCHGTADEVVPFGEAEALFQSYAGPKSHYWVAGASHYNVRQKANGQYLRQLHDFLQERMRPTVPSS
jgi:uncharacterized protein